MNRNIPEGDPSDKPPPIPEPPGSGIDTNWRQAHFKDNPDNPQAQFPSHGSTHSYPPVPPSAYPHPARPSLLKRLLAPALILLALLAKFGKLLLPALKFLPAALKTGGTMLLSIWVYAMLFGWKLALGFVVCIFIHELGHVFAARQVGIKNVSAPIFIPFMGAFILQKEAAKDAWAQAVIGIGGPVFGAWAGACCHYIGLYYDSPLFLAIAYITYMINLFNLIPLGHMDGGHIVSALSLWLHFVGVAIACVYLYFRPHSIILWLILIMTIPILIRTWKTRKTPEAMKYYQIPSQKRWIMGGCYFALMGLLVLAMDHSHKSLEASRDVIEHRETKDVRITE